MLIIVPVFGGLTSQFKMSNILPLIYLFFLLNILIFYLLFQSFGQPTRLAHAFMIWISVFNLFVVSVFWSFMTDLFTDDQAERLFGFIAAGGSAGALLGPGITAILAIPLGTVNLLLISAGFLLLAIICIYRLQSWTIPARSIADGVRYDYPHGVGHTEEGHIGFDREAIGGNWFAGFTFAFRSPYLMGISLFILLAAVLRTFLYFTQAHIVEGAFDDPATRTTLFAVINFGTNILTIGIQIFVTGRLLSKYGTSVALSVVPVFVMIAFLGLGVAPILPMLIIAQMGASAGNYAIVGPGREVLFTVVDREEKYKAKNFIDTVIYRAGDAASGWLFAGLTQIGLGLSALAFIAIPLTVIWAVNGYYLGKKQVHLSPDPTDREEVHVNA